MTTLTKLHPLEAVDWDMVEFWLSKVPGYKRSDQWHNPIHKMLIEPRYNEKGPVPTLVVLSGGEQAGKSMLGAAHVFATHWFSKVIWIVGERYEDCRKEFEYLVETGIATGALDKKNISFPQSPGPCLAIFNNGCTVRTRASSDVTTLASESPDGVLMVEVGRQTEQAFRTLLTRTIHHTGWILVSGTFESYKGRWFPDLWNTCLGDNEFIGKAARIPSYANPINYPDGEYDPKILAAKKALTEEEFSERFLGVPRAPVGVVFPEFRRSTHVSFSAEFERSIPVRLWVDPGFYPSSYSVLFTQLYGPRIHIFDEIYVQHMVNDQVVDMVLNHEAFRNVDRVVIDIAAQAHVGAQDTAMEAWRQKLVGRGIPVVAKYVKIHDGISRTHDKLRINPLDNRPYLIIHPRCDATIMEFEDGYRFHMRHDGAVAGDVPIDRNNHSVKALAYGIVDAFGASDATKYRAVAPTRRRLSFGPTHR